MVAACVPQGPQHQPVPDTFAFVKFEDVFRQYRPSYVEYDTLPQICFDGDCSHGIFTSVRRRSGRKELVSKKVSQTRYCECCDVTYTNITRHLDSFQHKMFMLTESNYANLDSVISELKSVSLLNSSLNTDTRPLPLHSDEPLIIDDICDANIQRLLVDYSDTSGANMDCSVSCTLMFDVCLFGCLCTCGF